MFSSFLKNRFFALFFKFVRYLGRVHFPFLIRIDWPHKKDRKICPESSNKNFNKTIYIYIYISKTFVIYFDKILQGHFFDIEIF